MNILFLLFSFLTIFALLSAHILKDSNYFTKELSYSHQYESRTRKLTDKFERYKYKEFIKEKKKQKERSASTSSSTKTLKATTYISHRKKDYASPSAKWNLLPLLSMQKNLASDALWSSLEDLLEGVYGHAPFWIQATKQTPNLAKEFVRSFQKRSQKKKPIESLTDLFPQEPLLQKPFYEMLQGCKKLSSCPPLSELLCLCPQETKVIQIPYASLPILEAILGTQISQKIASLEQEKWEQDHRTHSVTKAELQRLCTLYALDPKSSLLGVIEPYISFSHKLAKLDKLTDKDLQTDLTLHIPLPSS